MEKAFADSQPQLHFEILSQENRSEIVALRKQEYSRDYGPLVDLSRLEWNDKDERSLHLGFRSGHDLISCLRLTFIESAEALESVMAASLPTEPHHKNAVLARAATRFDFRQSHCHSFLRWKALQICCENQVDTVWGSAERSSPRLNQLMGLGYAVQAYDKKEDSFLRNASPTVALKLCGQNLIQNAIRQLEEKLKFHFTTQHFLFFHSSYDVRKINWL